MKKFFIASVLCILVQTIGFGQLDVDSIIRRYVDPSEIELSEVSETIELLIEEGNERKSEIIDLYASVSTEIGDLEHQARAKYYIVKAAKTSYDSSQLLIYNELQEFIHTNVNLSTSQEWPERVFEVSHLKANVLERMGNLEESVDLRYRLTIEIDSAAQTNSFFEPSRNHVINYFGLSSIYLFDNDEISTRYADSTIYWAQLLGAPSQIYSAYNMKYYTKYYEGNGSILSVIADSCIKYARLLESSQKLGEAYMHKCNALVELSRQEEGFKYCELAAAEYATLNDSSFLSSSIHNMGNVFQKAGEHEKALSFYQKALTYTSISHPSSYFNSYEAVADGLYELGEFKESAKYYHDFANDFYNYYSDQLNTKFAEAEEKYQSELKEAEIQRQQLLIDQQKNERNLLIGTGLAVLGILIAFFYAVYQRTQRKRKEAHYSLQLEQERNASLQKLSGMKTAFFNNVSHELRTPLTLVIAPLEDALKRVKNVDLRSELELSLFNSKRLLGLTNEILDFSKLDASKLELENEEVEIMVFLKRSFHAFDSLARTRKIELSDQIEIDKKWRVSIDAIKLQKVLNNLISNAIKYSSQDARVEFQAHLDRKSEELRVHIRDEGEGIAPSEMAKIFDRFYQAGNASQSSGTGIGLALVKELIEIMGGEIKVRSELGKGSEFSFIVPCKIYEGKSDASNHVEEQEVTAFEPIFFSGKKPELLIVEDDLEMSKYLVSLLKKDYSCDIAYNGIQALEKAKLKQYDLVTSDIMMPEMDGFQFRESLNEISGYNHTPFVMLTARSLEEDRLRGFQLGIDDYITKPFSSAEVKARIYNLLSNKVNRSDPELSDLEEGEDIVEKAKREVMLHLDNEKYNVEMLSSALNYSSRQLSRILKKKTGLTTVNFILELRLQKAFELIRDKKYETLNEVRYEIGIESASYFSNKFKARFGLSPSEMI